MAGLALFAAWRAAVPGERAAMPEAMMQVAAEMPRDFLLEPNELANEDTRRGRKPHFAERKPGVIDFAQ